MFLAAQIEAVVNLFGQSAGNLLLSILLILLAWCIFSYLHLRRIPGPLLASISNLPRLFWVVSRRAHLQHIALHKKYGKLVRMGPNMVSVADPAAIPIIYGFGQKFIKESHCFSYTLPQLFSSYPNSQTVRLLPCHTSSLPGQNNTNSFRYPG